MKHPVLPLLEHLGRGKIRQIRHFAAREAETAPWPPWVPPAVVQAYERRGVQEPWAHQVRAAEGLRSGKVVALATGTGSGKSLAGWLSVVSDIVLTTHPQAADTQPRYRARYTPTALYMAPTKALAADQVASLEELIRAGELDISVAASDGDAEPQEKEWARRYANIITTNPDFVHHVIAPHHERWQRLFRGLRLIFIDEAHAYRGVSGAHIALLVQRLLRIARHYGANPSVLVASATGGEPDTLAAVLTGTPVADVITVSGDAAPRGVRSVMVWEPPHLDDEPTSPRLSVIAESSMLFTELTASGMRTLNFARSRKAAETIAEIAREQLPLRGVDPDSVAAYRGGYLPEERRALERDLRSGSLRGLATTNALELGIDISGLDAVVVAGWPGSRASFWQQAGRAGRAGRPGVAILVVGEDPLEQYVADHPQELDAIEPVIIDATNPYVLAPHLCAAAAELPLTAEDIALFGPRAMDLVAELTARRGLRKRGKYWYWDQSQGASPHDLVQIRGAAADDVLVVEHNTGRLIGTVSKSQADSTVHVGAIYTHQSRTYLVEEYGDGVAAVRAGSFSYQTRTREHKRIDILDVVHQETHGAITWNYGVVETFTQVSGFDRLALPGREVVGHIPLDLPVHSFTTMAVWWHADSADLPVDSSDLPGSLHAVEHCAIGVMGLVSPCDRSDIGGLSTAHHAQTGQPTVFVYDGVAGGAGFAQSAYENRERWMQLTSTTLEQCSCEAGCPRCVFSPKCGNGNEPLSKEGARQLAQLLHHSSPLH